MNRKDSQPKVDRRKLRRALCELGNEYLYDMLHDAIDLMPEPELAKLAAKYLDVRTLHGPDSDGALELLREVLSFERSSLAGEFHQSFNVNSKNYMQKSPRTLAWIAEFNRLLDKCVATRALAPGALRDALERMFGLLRRIDQGNDDIIFFADEAGSWQVGVNWAEVFPPCVRAVVASIG